MSAKKKETNLLIEEDSIGYYLYVFDPFDPRDCTQDYLLDSLADAFKEAEKRFGVKEAEWKIL